MAPILPTHAPSAPARTYTPGAPSEAWKFIGYASLFGGYNLHSTYLYSWCPSIRESVTQHSSGSESTDEQGVRRSNGVTTYSPYASSGQTNYSPTAPPVSNGNTYAPPLATGTNSSAQRYSPPTGMVSHSTHAVYNLPEAAGNASASTGNPTLTPSGSQSVLHQVNTARTGMTGINKHRSLQVRWPYIQIRA